MTLSLSQRLFDLPADKGGRPPFPFKQPQSIPQPDEFAFCFGVHGLLRGRLN
jgi:hypothetical protein